MKKSLVFTALFVAVAFMPASATIINVPADQPNIQAGIDASSNGDTVRVAEGTYVENINFSGKNIVLGSWFLDDGDPSYILSTIIDGGSSGSVVTFENGEDNTAIITGFTIQNGDVSLGGGIYCYGSNPTISDNAISGNSGLHKGGGIFCWDSSPTINHNTISGNSADHGAGIYCRDDPSPTISYNTITGNSGGWAGGGIYCHYSSPAISNNTISGNSAVTYGGGIRIYYSSPVITNTIFWGDSAHYGPEIYVIGTSSPVITYCDVQGGWEGEGNIDIDPLFRDPVNDDFHLQSMTNPDCGGPGDSPCIDTGDPSICDLVLDCDNGLGEIRSDMGAYGGGINCGEIPTLSEWGMIILALLLLTAGTIAVVRRRKAAVARTN